MRRFKRALLWCWAALSMVLDGLCLFVCLFCFLCWCWTAFLVLDGLSGVGRMVVFKYTFLDCTVGVYGYHSNGYHGKLSKQFR